MKEITLVKLIQKLVKKEGAETADNIIAGMMIIHKDYISLKMAIQDYLNECEG